jgi:hypothetical protein
MPLDVVVLRFGDRRVPNGLRDLRTVGCGDTPGAVDVATFDGAGRIVVLGSPADLAAVLTALLRAERLDVEVSHVPGRRGVRRALRGSARRVPLIRDETGTVIVGSAEWTAGPLLGEAVVDDTVLFDGEVAGVRIEPTAEMPGLRAAVLNRRGRPRGWVTGRAAQLGTKGAQVIRDGVPAARTVKRSTFYRHTQGWLRVD